jgi:hypothetical protein
MTKAIINTATIAALATCILLSGCGRKITVQASEDVCKKSIEIDLVGVNAFEKDMWESMSMTDYWSLSTENSAGKMRANSKDYRLTFGKGEADCTIELSEKKDIIWKTWKKRNAEYILILADLTGRFEDQQGNADLRRLCLPLNKECWKGGKIVVNIESGSIVPITLPKGKCSK